LPRARDRREMMKGCDAACISIKLDVKTDPNCGLLGGRCLGVPSYGGERTQGAVAAKLAKAPTYWKQLVLEDALTIMRNQEGTSLATENAFPSHSLHMVRI